MSGPDDSQKKPVKKQQDSKPGQASLSYKTLYLTLYNLISALLWSVVLGRTLLIAGIYGHDEVYAGVGSFTKWTQTLAGLEVLHAAIGTMRQLINNILARC